MLPPRRGRGRLPRSSGGMNRLERAYADHLEELKVAGEIVGWWREPFNVRIADKCFWKPDFLVQLPDGTLEFHETKGGFFSPDSKVRCKVAAEKYPFMVVRLIHKRPKKAGGGWDISVFGPAEEAT